MKDQIFGRLVSFAKKHPILRSVIVYGLFVILFSVFVGLIYYDGYYDGDLPLSDTVGSVDAGHNESNTQSGAFRSEDESISTSQIVSPSTIVASEDYITEEKLVSDSVSDPVLPQTDQAQAFEGRAPEKSLPEPKVTLPYDSSEQWALTIFNRDNPIPEDYEVELVSIGKKGKCDSRIKDSLNALLSAAKEDGCGLYVTSAYRTTSRQDTLYNRKVKTYLRNGDTEEIANQNAGRIVAYPGTSEHEVGLAFDFLESGYSELDEGFEMTKSGMWLKEHAKEFGFVLRYPKGKESVTGILYEPWHYRYVGEVAARAIMDNEITLEEYLINIGE